MSATETSDKPPAGVTVVEIGNERTEWCGKLFSQGGAHVILVEPPGGAESRAKAPFYEGIPGSERSVHFWYYNTDKDSITLDLHAREDRETFLELLKRSDILLDGARPGEMDVLG